MTANQINYARLKEEQRSNRANEGIKSQSISEEQRHNMEQERVNWYGADTSRSVGMANAQAALSQAGAAHRQAGVRERSQDWEETKYHDTGKDWISAQTDKLYYDALLGSKKAEEYEYYTPFERAVMQQSQDTLNYYLGPLGVAFKFKP